MSLWKSLFKKRAASPPSPVLQPLQSALPEAEVLRLDALDAIDAQPRKLAYWRTLHPLVQAYWITQVGWEYEAQLPIDRSDASSVFYRWGYSVSSYTFQVTPRQEEWLRRCESVKETLWQQSQEALRRFSQIEEEASLEQEQAWQAYWIHYQSLSSPQQHLVAWELAKRGNSQGRSGFHGGLNALPPFPFSPCGWANYRHPNWGDSEGVAFAIRRACFGGRKPLLYYLDDDNWPWQQEEEALLTLIRRYSSGISHIRVEQCRCKGWDGEVGQRRVVLFEPDPAAIRKTVCLSGKAVSTTELGEYIFVLPRAGEFNCLLGEIRDGEMIPLHRDDFCMK